MKSVSSDVVDICIIILACKMIKNNNDYTKL